MADSLRIIFSVVQSFGITQMNGDIQKRSTPSKAHNSFHSCGNSDRIHHSSIKEQSDDDTEA